jgi:predicted nucleotidyltransferase
VALIAGHYRANRVVEHAARLTPIDPHSTLECMASASASRWSKVRAAAERAATRELAREQEAAERQRNQALASLRPLIACARQLRLCDRAWLFGSYAWGTPGSESDLDLLVDGDADAVATLLSEHIRLPLHVMRLDAAPRTLRDRVHRDGLPL